MMSANINDYALMPLKTVEAALADFDCGREDIDDFFHNKAQAYRGDQRICPRDLLTPQQFRLEY